MVKLLARRDRQPICLYVTPTTEVEQAVAMQKPEAVAPLFKALMC